MARFCDDGRSMRFVGQAVIAHVKANMGDEEPKLLCYAPESPKKHPIVK